MEIKLNLNFFLDEKSLPYFPWNKLISTRHSTVTFQCPIHDQSSYSVQLKLIGGRLGTTFVNGWQLAKMKKSIPDMSLP